MITLLAPGQGAQTPRMLTPWLRDPGVREQLASWSQLIDIDLVGLGTDAPAGDIARTENTQPLLVAQGLLAADLPFTDALVAGHSVGELTAAVFAGVLDAADAIRLAAARGAAMADACRRTATSMAAVIGGEPETVLDHLHDLGLQPANFNGPGQIVAAGAVEAVAALLARPLPGTAVKELAVAGAFHTHFMDEAQQRFADVADGITFHDARLPMVSNLDGQPVTAGAEVRRRLVTQITAPVRWDLCLATIASHEPRLAIAAPPGRVLSGIIARQMPHLRCISITTPRDLAAAQHAIARADSLRSETALVGAGV